MTLLSHPTALALKEYGRGLAGGLLFSLPMLYTMEIWWTGFIASPVHLIIYVLVTFVLLLAYNYYVGIRQNSSWRDEFMDAVEEIGLGMLVAALVLYLIGRVRTDMPWDEVTGKIIVEAMPVAIGVAVGKVQLGGGGDDDKGHGQNGGGEQDQKGGSGENGSKGPENAHSKTTATGSQLVLGLCGAILVAANVAPTEEIVLIGIETNVWKLLGLVVFSIGVGGSILYFSDFHGADRVMNPESGFDIVAGIVMMYGVALIASAFMLWFFGRFEGMPIYLIAAQTVVLGFPAALGASAGRLLLQA